MPDQKALISKRAAEHGVVDSYHRFYFKQKNRSCFLVCRPFTHQCWQPTIHENITANINDSRNYYPSKNWRYTANVTGSHSSWPEWQYQLHSQRTSRPRTPTQNQAIYGQPITYTPGRELSLDKSMIGFKRHLGFVQYIPKKPDWRLADDRVCTQLEALYRWVGIHRCTRVPIISLLFCVLTPSLVNKL